MPKFRYTVKEANGQTKTAVTEAFNRDTLVKHLQSQGYFVLKVEEDTGRPQPAAASAGRSPARKFARRGIKLIDLLTFARQLTTMLEAGVTLFRSLEVISNQVESEEFYKVLRKVTEEVERGGSLSQALADHPKVFDQFWVSLIEVGEASGTMPTVLNRLVFYLEQQAAFRSTIISALIYPAVLFMVCCGAVVFFALVVGPKFEGVFKSMNVDLPLITRVLLGLFRFIKAQIIWLVLGASGLVFLFRKWVATAAGRRQVEGFLYGLPVFGPIYKLIVIEHFTSQMAILVDSGVPILYALDISQRLVDNLTCARIIGEIKESVRQGELLVAPMERSGFFPGMCLQMITVGEETGELAKMLNHVAKFYQETVETFMKRFGTLIEPFMLVFMGGIIGVIVLAMFLPMFNIAQLGGAGGG